MYAREIDGIEHTFGVSGKLIMNALVMYDHQTRTLWSQFLGRGVEGPLKGVDLEFVPVTHTQWSLWHESHPDTLVLDKRGGYQRDIYLPYYYDSSAGVIGEAVKDNRLDRKDLVVGVASDGYAKAYPLDALKDTPLVNDTVSGSDIVIFLEPETDTILVYDRVVDGQALTFKTGEKEAGYEASFVDEETGSTWMALTGRAVDGPLKDTILERSHSHLSYWFAWKDWNPKTEVFQKPG